ncbi:MAG: YgaP family membrane protein [Ktedonobacterales bacterium]
MDSVITFMQSTTGRITRIILGIALIVVGFIVQGAAGLIIGLIGVVPLIAGMAGICLFAPLFGYTLHGHRRLQRTGPLY